MPRRKDPRIPDGVGGRAARRGWKISGAGLVREHSRVAWRIVRCGIQLTRQVDVPHRFRCRKRGQLEYEESAKAPVFALFVVYTCTRSTC